MKKDDFLMLMNEIDASILEECDPEKPLEQGKAPKRPPILRFVLAGAAAVLLVAAAAVGVTLLEKNKTPHETTPSYETTDALEDTGKVSVKAGNRFVDATYGYIYAVCEDEESCQIVGTSEAVGSILTLPDALNDLPVVGILWDEDVDLSEVDTLIIPDDAVNIRYDVGEIAYGHLRRIIVERGNPRYKVVNGCLIDTGTQTLMRGFDPAGIPDDGSVRYIGHNAFACCDVEKLILPDCIEHLYEGAFADCRSLKEIIFGEGLTSIAGAFRGCTALTSVTIPENLSVISLAFENCTALREVVFEGAPVALGAFIGCTSLTSVEIPEGSVHIWQSMFEGCTSLKKVILPEGIAEIEQEAFKDCAALKQIDLPKGVENVGKNAFAGCSSLKKVSGLQEVPTVYTGAFDGTNLLKNNKTEDEDAVYLFDWLYALKTDELSGAYTVKEGVAKICGGVFLDCSDLENVTVPAGVKSIGVQAFAHCTKLTSVTLPEGVEYLGSSAFYGCSSLYSIALPKSVEELHEATFAECTALMDISLPGVTRATTSDFRNCDAYRAEPSHWIDGCLYVDNLLIEADERAEKIAVRNGAVIISPMTFFLDYRKHNVKELYLPNDLTLPEKLCIRGVGSVRFENIDAWEITSAGRDGVDWIPLAEKYEDDLFSGVGGVTIRLKENVEGSGEK